MDPKRVSAALLGWYDRNRRVLPWRELRDPYRVWVSEVMLQQTQVATVERYYARFIERFPTLSSLARANEHDVMHAWQGLGYYSRARRLKQAAETVVRTRGGRLPTTRDELALLPGIGRYTAGAIASIAFAERVPVVDGNVVRVLTRNAGLFGDPARAPLAGRLWALAEALVPAARPGDFNQALMELGATVCTPRAPRCGDCPLARSCVARARGLTARLPELPERPAATRVGVAAAIVWRGERVLVERVRDDAVRWAGMFAFPYAELADREPPARAAGRAALAAGARVRIGERVATLAYTITRFRITLDAFAARLQPGARLVQRDGARSAFHPLESLEELAMPAPHRRLARALSKQEGGG